MSRFVVDTNVPVVANGRSQQAGPDCVLACLRALMQVRDHGIIVLDDSMLILKEYMRNLNLSGQPGAGDLFMKWVWTIQSHPDHCQQVSITSLDKEQTNFVEFPLDGDLAGFDPADRKFVAVALASESSPTVLNAVDSDWADHHRALARNGIDVEFLCPQHVSPKD